MSNMILSDKYKAFLRHNAKAEALEGTTAAGKTTVGAFKFMLKVAKSSKSYTLLLQNQLVTRKRTLLILIWG